MSMIYRVWIQGGHPFDYRNERILPENNSKISYYQNINVNDCYSPIFFLFLNCVKIVISQFL